MRRADRLFQIIQILRRSRVTTASALAEELEVSERTVYRDVRDLITCGVPITGEAGVGYGLDRSFELPPLMFNVEELEALALGARVVAGWADKELARAAKDAVTKVEAVLPKGLKRRLSDAALFAVNFDPSPRVRALLGELRPAIREHRKVRIIYTDAAGAASDRTLRPLCLTFFSPLWMLTAWCELRTEFRNFRLDRIREVHILDAVFIDEPGKGLQDFLASVGDAP